MIRCYHCGTDNLDGSEYCDECGTKLAAPTTPARSASAQPPTVTTQSGPSPTPSAPPPPSFTREAVTPKPATPYTPPPPPVHLSAVPPAAPAGNQTPPSAITSVAPYPNQTSINNGPTDNLTASNFNARGGLNSGANSVNNSGSQSPVASDQPSPNNAAATRARLVIQRGGQVGKEFPLVGAEAMIGRWDADGGIFPDVDLDQDDPEAKVSRRHARIHCQNSQYLIEDLGSTNGTFINRGPRLLPGNKQPLHHGDEIIVGKTFLKFVLS